VLYIYIPIRNTQKELPSLVIQRVKERDKIRRERSVGCGKSIYSVWAFFNNEWITRCDGSGVRTSREREEQRVCVCVGC
jgi:hypothetical protein